MNYRGQSALEYTILLIVIMGALIATQIYFKRGIQGRLRSTIDELGDQYDPRNTTGAIIQTVTGVTNTWISAQNSVNGYQTIRVDSSNFLELKTGSLTVGTYNN